MTDIIDEMEKHRVTIIIILGAIFIIVILWLSYFYSIDATGAITLINNKDSSITIDNMNPVSCSTYDINNLHIGQIVRITQDKSWPFPSSCSLTILSDK